MKMFGSGISYLTIDLIGIWKTSDEHDFAEKRDRYLSTEKPPDAFYYHQLDYGEEASLVNSRCDPKPFTMKYIEAFSGKYNHEKRS